MATGWLWHELFGWHDTGSSAGYIRGDGLQPYAHVESADTKVRFASLIGVAQLDAHLVSIEHLTATKEDILRVHEVDYVNRIKNLSNDPRGGDAGDGFSPFAQGGYDIALLAAGGTMSAVKAVLEGTVSNAYALVRPPGHHATPETGMGFCMFANIAVAIKYAKTNLGLQRVAVVDWDVHHGNGTEACFQNDPSVLTISLHQDGNFPRETGKVDHRGEGDGFGANINIPLPPGTGIGGYRFAFEKVVLPALQRFRPELIIVASGFDASIMDPLGRMMLLSEDYAEMTSLLMSVADELCDGKLVINHEGGYSPFYVPFCGLSVVETLSGQKSKVDDPYLDHVRSIPGRELTDIQAGLVEKLSAHLSDIPS